ncbi:MAG: aminotransferase class IV [Candidatus Thermoplasmatota archaeon]|nr:aminotransferase class IV [Candidatus Thermoplasmatota archaeon]
MSGDPRSEVFTTVAWDGETRLLAADLHIARLYRHAERLGFNLPDNLAELIFEPLSRLEIPGEPVVGENQAPFLVKIGVKPNGKVELIPRVNGKWPSTMTAISLAAPRWDGVVRGTKHGDWKPYFDAREVAKEHGADISLLFDDDSLVDGDRCMPVLLDNDGIAYYPKASEGALDSVTLEQIREGIESAGVPVREARITLPMLLRASEMIVLGSGLGVQILGEIDGRVIGQPHGRLYQAAHDAWMIRLQTAWMSLEDLEG